MKEFKIGQKVDVRVLGEIISYSKISGYLIRINESSIWFSESGLEASTREPEPELEGKEMRLIVDMPGSEIGKVYHVRDVKDLLCVSDNNNTHLYIPHNCKSYFQPPDLPVRVRGLLERKSDQKDIFNTHGRRPEELGTT
jgi:hypothetical protein